MSQKMRRFNVKTTDCFGLYLFSELTENKDFITELGLQKSSAWLVPTHSILFSNGATIGEITITTYPVCTKQGILGIVPKPNIDVEFLYYFMSSSYSMRRNDTYCIRCLYEHIDKEILLLHGQ